MSQLNSFTKIDFCSGLKTFNTAVLYTTLQHRSRSDTRTSQYLAMFHRWQSQYSKDNITTYLAPSHSHWRNTHLRDVQREKHQSGAVNGPMSRWSHLWKPVHNHTRTQINTCREILFTAGERGDADRLNTLCLLLKLLCRRDGLRVIRYDQGWLRRILISARTEHFQSSRSIQ